MEGFSAADGADKQSSGKSAQFDEADAYARSSLHVSATDEKCIWTYEAIGRLVRKWSALYGLDDHHAGKLRKSLEKRAEGLRRKYDPARCGNYEGYIARCLAKFAGCDASRAKDQQTFHGEVSLDEPVDAGDGDEDAATRLDFLADDEEKVERERRIRDVREAVALLPPRDRRICEWIMAGWSEERIAAELGMHRTTYKRYVFPEFRAAFGKIFGDTK